MIATVRVMMMNTTTTAMLTIRTMLMPSSSDIYINKIITRSAKQVNLTCINHQTINNKKYYHCSLFRNLCVTRMHSSRMRTVRCSGHLGGGGFLPMGCLGGVCLGGICPVGLFAQEGVSAWGSVCPGESVQGCLPRGVSAWGCLSMEEG